MFFIWVARSQKQYEWFTDIIRDVEEADKKNNVETHIFVTQFFDKFDLRTTMLVSCTVLIPKYVLHSCKCFLFHSTSVSVTSRSCLARVCSLVFALLLISVVQTSINSLTVCKKSTSSCQRLVCSRVDHLA